MGQNLTKKEIKVLKEGNLKSIKKHFDIENSNKTNTKGKTPLHFACFRNADKQILEYLISRGSNVNQQDDNGYAPLHMLCSSQFPLLIDSLDVMLNSGAQLNISANNGKTTIHIAATNDLINLETFKYMIESGGDVNAIDGFQKTPLMCLCETEKPDPLKIRVLLEARAHVNVEDKWGFTPLHFLVKNTKDVSLIEMLIKNGAKVNAQNLQQQTPLHCLFETKSPSKSVVKVLIQSGANLSILDKQGKTVLHYTALNKEIKTGITSLLLENGSDPLKKNYQGQTPLKLSKKISNSIVNKEIKSFLSENGSTDFGKEKESIDNKVRDNMLKKITSLTTFHEIPPEEIEIIRRVGNGAFKEVFEGNWKKKCVAVAKLIEGKNFNEEQLSDFTQETITVCNLDHPNIVKYYGGCIKDTQLMIICEFCKGGDLYDLLHSKKDLNKKQKIQIAIDVANGIKYLHQNHLVHRDLKSPNVLLTEKGKAKITDFGLSKTMNTSMTFMNNTIVGTPRWMAPELLRGEQNYTNKVDIYAFGILLWEISTREIPFEGIGPFQLSGLIGFQGQRPELNENYLFFDLIKKCWDQDPQVRPTIETVIKDLQAYLLNYL
ncbi:mitogen-activated protein kinase kinase kinase 20 [Anaeramoeba flamelloides]|uniref:Mitogen-activated protein kinase kinase kinase 20 n=1 Tax=Anaeramoeba flamelloides TaxID=1746091 RepID=A0ABQ8YJW7_9EUKA|nr:mitogen-activated protein kinase kinase kinase 20 [Anaeramoeba flamelloides]